MVARILQAEGRGATMVFTRTKRTAQKVADELAERGFKVGAVHGDLGQIAREKALKAFRTGEVDVLVATDVAARGIDIDDITHVINYQIPEDEQAYVHRIGRTGRAGKTGIAITLVDWDEVGALVDDHQRAQARRSPIRPRPTPPRRTSTKNSASRPARRACCRGPTARAPGSRPRSSRTSARPAARAAPAAAGAGAARGHERGRHGHGEGHGHDRHRAAARSAAAARRRRRHR